MGSVSTCCWRRLPHSIPADSRSLLHSPASTSTMSAVCALRQALGAPTTRPGGRRGRPGACTPRAQVQQDWRRFRSRLIEAEAAAGETSPRPCLPPLDRAPQAADPAALPPCSVTEATGNGKQADAAPAGEPQRAPPGLRAAGRHTHSPPPAPPDSRPQQAAPPPRPLPAAPRTRRWRLSRPGRTAWPRQSRAACCWPRPWRTSCWAPTSGRWVAALLQACLF